MIHRTIAAALLAGLSSQALAGQFAGPAYDQAAGMAAGKSADAAYDGRPAQTAVRAQVAGALTTGGLSVEASPAATNPALMASAVPQPLQAAKKGNFFTKPGVLFGGGVAAGAGLGWYLGHLGGLGGPLGAVIGALAGFAIGFLLSKVLA